MKKSLSERDICTKFITPAIQKAGWDVTSQIREEVSFNRTLPICQMPSGKLVPKKSQMASGQSQEALPESSVHISQTPSAKLAAAFPLSWSQYVFLLGIRGSAERQFYEIEAARNSWALPELKNMYCLLRNYPIII